MIRIAQRQAPHVSMEAMQSTSRPPGRDISWYASHGMRSTLQWGYCSLACDAIRVTWSDRRPATSRGLEIRCPVYGHTAQQGWWYTTVL